jgi:hypothetical protein
MDTLIAIGVFREDVVGIKVVEYRMTRHDVDATHGIDQLDQSKKTNPDVVIDVDMKVVLHCSDRRASAAVRVRPVDLSRPAHRHGYVQVTRNRQHDYLLGRRHHPDQDHRLGQNMAGVKFLIVVRSEKQYGECAHHVRHGRRGRRCG